MTGLTWANFLDSTDLEDLRVASVGRIATVGVGGFPSVVPVCFGLVDGSLPTIVSVLDDKPKGVADTELGRVRNILRHPQVGLTIDHYEEDWSKLFHIQIRGVARIALPDDPIHAPGLGILRAKYPQYRVMELADRSMIAIDQLRVRVWRARPVSKH